MGSGKSTLGRLAAGELGRRFVDLDDEVEQRESLTIAELFDRGEPGFRAAETRALEAALGDPEPVVVATGGGIVTVAENRQMLSERARSIWLVAAPAVLAARVGSGEGRPLLGEHPLDRLSTILDERQELYAVVADERLDVGASTIDEALTALCAMAGSGP